jgi:hypothetical protein
MNQNFYICPHLNLIDDSKDRDTYPSDSNACYAQESPFLVVHSYQQDYCLKLTHTECPGFINGWIDGVPKSLCRSGSAKKFFKK